MLIQMQCKELILGDLFLNKVRCSFFLLFIWLQVQRSLMSLRNVSSKSELQNTYQHLQKDLKKLDHLAFKRQQVRNERTLVRSPI